MRTRQLLAWVLVVAVLVAFASWLTGRDRPSGDDAAGPALPGFAARVEAVDRLEVAGAGNQVLVAIEKHDGRWRMPDRTDWPANQREIASALFRLGQARRIEAKTADPQRHARLGVEAVSSADAKGTELRLAGGGEPLRLVVGENHPGLGGSYVRVGDDPQAWLLDEDIAPARDPVDWLDRRLLDIPMARIDVVRVTPAKGRAFVLSRIDDRFSLDGQPPVAMTDPDAGNATAGFPDQLPLDDVARDSGAAATQTVVFEGLDGVNAIVAAWRQDGGTWARLRVELDETRARAWFAQAAEAEGMDDGAAAAGEGAEVADATPPSTADAPDSPEQRLTALRQQVAAWQASFADRQFLLPPYKAEGLMKTRDDYLAGRR